MVTSGSESRERNAFISFLKDVSHGVLVGQRSGTPELPAVGTGSLNLQHRHAKHELCVLLAPGQCWLLFD